MYPCIPVFDTIAPAKTQTENGLDKLFDLQGQNIDVLDQYIFIFMYTYLHDE